MEVVESLSSGKKLIAGGISVLVDLRALATEPLLGPKIDVLKKDGTDELLAYLDLGTLT